MSPHTGPVGLRKMMRLKNGGGRGGQIMLRKNPWDVPVSCMPYDPPPPTKDADLAHSTLVYTAPFNLRPVRHLLSFQWGGGGGVVGREDRVSANGRHKNGNEAGVCPHARVGTPKGASEKRWQSEWDDGTWKTQLYWSHRDQRLFLSFSYFSFKAGNKLVLS